jgi:hypothetical protein
MEHSKQLMPNAFICISFSSSLPVVEGGGREELVLVVDSNSFNNLVTRMEGNSWSPVFISRKKPLTRTVLLFNTNNAVAKFSIVRVAKIHIKRKKVIVREGEIKL